VDKKESSAAKNPLLGAIKKGDSTAISNIMSVQKVDISDLKDANGNTGLHIASGISLAPPISSLFLPFHFKM
jgi:ankyrin repeat protein